MITGHLRDFAVQPLTGFSPLLEFVPSKEAITPDGILVSRAIPADTLFPDGSFYVWLEVTDGLPADVFFRPRVSWYKDVPGRGRVVKADQFPDVRVYVPAGGGDLKDLIELPPITGMVWIGSAVPAQAMPGDLQYDPNDGVGGLYRIGKNMERTFITSIRGLQGPEGKQGPRGLDGVNAVANDTATAGQIDNLTSQTRFSLESDFAQVGVPAAVAAMTRPGKIQKNAASILAPWYGRLAWRKNFPVKIGLLGDSIVEGYGTDGFEYTLVQDLARSMRARHPTPGAPSDFGGRGFIGSNKTNSLTSFVWPVAVTGDATVGSNDYGPKRQTIALGANGQLVYSLFGDACEIMFVKLPGGGSFRWRVDAGAWTTVSTNNATALDGVLQFISLGTRGAHTLTIQAVTNGSYIDGVIEYNADQGRGIHVHDLGHGGYKASSWVAGASSPTANWPASIYALGLDILVIALGTNEEAQNDTPASFLAGLNSLSTLIRPVFAGPIVFLAYPRPDGETVASHLSYVDQMYTAAATDGKAVVCDLSQRLPGYNVAQTFFDGLHPNQAGCQSRADMLAAFLSPS